MSVARPRASRPLRDAVKIFEKIFDTASRKTPVSPATQS
jgi:hypothetical protein